LALYHTKTESKGSEAVMKKSTLIGTCLLNSGMVTSLKDGENNVGKVFTAEFPSSDYLKWDTDVESSVADHMIKEVGRASNIDVRTFIEDLWDQ